MGLACANGCVQGLSLMQDWSVGSSKLDVMCQRILFFCSLCHSTKIHGLAGQSSSLRSNHTPLIAHMKRIYVAWLAELQIISQNPNLTIFSTDGCPKAESRPIYIVSWVWHVPMGVFRLMQDWCFDSSKLDVMSMEVSLFVACVIQPRYMA